MCCVRYYTIRRVLNMVLEWEVGWLVGESLVMGCFELFNGWRLEAGGGGYLQVVAMWRVEGYAGWDRWCWLMKSGKVAGW